ncbi:AAA family ATPase [Alkalicoccobacillus murimartini]|uniref:SpoVK/Ycf46/Vps4 family AAA+-type ATPase n=1 Tax=Alkalicoccobacillus murimartini TaxID=171685 RepID=A0ABT9YEG2_9BACI|nr:AAA family ATPase [Alkalicoccobacillus murimartini]MDQ0206222.1 SpoVK/Ycf46/Vps4 family AAA+-type ATPase [Alkalicoccobacillus murimartini]
MLQSMESVQELKNWMVEIKEGRTELDETRLWRSLSKWDDHLKSEESQLYADALSHLALVRFNRLSKMDSLITEWINEANRYDPKNNMTQTLQVEILLDEFVRVAVPSDYPSIRETDHGSAKRKTAEAYYHLAEQFFQSEEKLKTQYSQIQESAKDVVPERVETIQALWDLFIQFRDPFLRIAKTTEAYAHSLDGVYYSASQFKELKQAVEEIKVLQKQWQEQLEKITGNTVDESALNQLSEMIGLTEVKKRVQKLYQFLTYQKKRERSGYKTKDGINLNMILTGNPGTGKTTIARLLAKTYYELGLLKQESVLEVDRSQLVAGYVGQTEEQTLQAIERASGGVLFIDEAYSLKRADASGNDYGQTVIDTLVSAMTSGQYAGTFAVIMAGYPEEMRTFLRSNPGLRSRFPEQNHLHLPDYSIDELIEISEHMAIENDFILTEEALVSLREEIERAQVDQTFGNARTVQNLVLEAIFEKGASEALQEEKEDFVLLEANHFKQGHQSNRQLAFSKLHELVGLQQVKDEVSKLTAYAEVQRLRREQNLQAMPVQLHSVFSGSPGTGKTTVASIYAQALKEIGLLKRGHLVRVGRADLVSGYSGQTAIKTKEVIKDALGGVLFIDEAYSLIQGAGSDYGQEAVAALVEAMTIHDENLVVVLAGYEQEIEQLLAVNPGLRSRFRKHIVFDDYTHDELIIMLSHLAERNGYHFTEDAMVETKQIVPEEGHLSNGRYIDSLFERIVQQQAIRVSQIESPDTKALQEITKLDVEKA